MGRLFKKRFSPPDVPFVEASRKGGRQRPSLIVLQSSFTSTDAGAALAIAQAMHNSRAKESFHYIVDEGFTFRGVPNDRVAVFNNEPEHALGVLLCDDPSGLSSRWDARSHQDLLHRSSDLVAQLCLAHSIRPVYLTTDQLGRWRKWRTRRRGGIVTSGFLAQTYWPEEYFLKLVKAHIAKYKLDN